MIRNQKGFGLNSYIRGLKTIEHGFKVLEKNCLELRILFSAHLLNKCECRRKTPSDGQFLKRFTYHTAISESHCRTDSIKMREETKE